MPTIDVVPSGVRLLFQSIYPEIDNYFSLVWLFRDIFHKLEEFVVNQISLTAKMQSST